MFCILNALLRNILSEAILRGKFLKLQEPYHIESKLYLVRFDKYMINLPFL